MPAVNNELSFLKRINFLKKLSWGHGLFPKLMMEQRNSKYDIQESWNRKVCIK